MDDLITLEPIDTNTGRTIAIDPLYPPIVTPKHLAQLTQYKRGIFSFGPRTYEFIVDNFDMLVMTKETIEETMDNDPDGEKIDKILKLSLASRLRIYDVIKYFEDVTVDEDDLELFLTDEHLPPFWLYVIKTTEDGMKLEFVSFYSCYDDLDEECSLFRVMDDDIDGFLCWYSPIAYADLVHALKQIYVLQ